MSATPLEGHDDATAPPMSDPAPSADAGEAAPLSPEEEERAQQLFLEGEAARDQGDYEKAFHKYSDAAQSSRLFHTDAITCIGCMYADGLFVPQDFSKAMEAFQLAADRGNTRAMCHLAYILDQQGADDKAFALYSRAAALGDLEGLCQKGYMHHTGTGTEVDLDAARKCWLAAAEQGWVDAQYNLGVMYHMGSGVEMNEKTACMWYERAAAQKHAGALVALGLMYKVGLGSVQQEYSQAMYCFQAAAQEGDPSAQFEVGLLFHDGLGVPQDYSIAASWFLAAAEQDFADAQLALAPMFKNGLGVTADPNECMKWLSRAAANGQPDAIECMQRLQRVLAPALASMASASAASDGAGASSGAGKEDGAGSGAGEAEDLLGHAMANMTKLMEMDPAIFVQALEKMEGGFGSSRNSMEAWLARVGAKSLGGTVAGGPNAMRQAGNFSAGHSQVQSRIASGAVTPSGRRDGMGAMASATPNSSIAAVASSRAAAHAAAAFAVMAQTDAAEEGSKSDKSGVRGDADKDKDAAGAGGAGGATTPKAGDDASAASGSPKVAPEPKAKSKQKQLIDEPDSPSADVASSSTARDGAEAEGADGGADGQNNRGVCRSCENGCSIA